MAGEGHLVGLRELGVAEAVLQDQIAEKEKELATAEDGANLVESELEALRHRLAEVQGAIDEVEAEPIEDDDEGKAAMSWERERLAALVAQLEGKAEDDSWEAARDGWIEELDRIEEVLRGL